MADDKREPTDSRWEGRWPGRWLTERRCWIGWALRTEVELLLEYITVAVNLQTLLYIVLYLCFLFELKGKARGGRQRKR